MSSNLSFLKGRRVFVTGHTGFKGSWLSQILIDAGAEVSGFSLPPTNVEKHFQMLGIESSISNHFGDIRDPKSIEFAIQSEKPEIVFHLAAQALVRSSYSNPLLTYETNVIGSLNLLQAVHLSDAVRSLVYITSDKCYENQEWPWGYRESDTLGGLDPYSSSKACAEILFSSFQRSFLKTKNISSMTARAGNVIGGGDWSLDRIVPDCVRASEKNEPIILRQPDSTRPWQHVLEPLSGYLRLAQLSLEKPKIFDGSWNFGPSSANVRTVKEVAETLIGGLGGGTVKVETNHNLFHEANLLQLNCDKASTALGWQPKWNIDTTLEKTISWFRSVREGAAVRDVTRAQISEYFGGQND